MTYSCGKALSINGCGIYIKKLNRITKSNKHGRIEQ